MSLDAIDFFCAQFVSVSAAHVGDPDNMPAPQWRDRMYMTPTLGPAFAGPPSPLDVLDSIDIQLLADSDEIVLSRDHAEVLACLLHDLCGIDYLRGPKQ